MRLFIAIFTVLPTWPVTADVSHDGVFLLFFLLFIHF